jgi:8-oxo-dGTP diphosphatase
MKQLAVVLLVDPNGWILLQERDSGAPVAPDKWGMVGGHVEDGESFDEAVHRELLEETGLSLPKGSLQVWVAEQFSYSNGSAGDYRVYFGRTEYTDADVTVGEGRQIVFVDPDQIPSLDKSESCAHFVPRFLESDQYRDLAGAR